ncbi:D-alanyl-D-alanine carboxypeptidase family protein [Rhodocyclus purpureus]|uniref:D-alanyl-D-alanine carboxypeptidase family protein n=1 Tax=Rhodocyclus purpureus TaxID=1067 RepID=UPI001913D4C8|nr:D-alanyl-D-alanine carboxypeptidase family protein [Rhodocyclus purpureus]MBK5914175.1 peptidase [Rhodocyclus purpureus]
MAPLYSFRRFLAAVLVLLTCASAPAAAEPGPASPALAAKAWLLIEFASGQTLSEQGADERLEPASLTKLMTAYLSFAALKDGTLKRDQAIKVSENAWRAPGSRMFLLPGKPVVVEDLIKGMIVHSGNDATLALAEQIGGSEEGFVQMMNRQAQRLGMKASSFRNPTGLPDPQHYSTARDLATLTSALIRDFPDEYARYYALKEFRHNDITQPNRNRLLWMDPSVDGVKTGHTQAAGYCLISSAKRGQRRLLAVVLGTASEAARAQESQKLLDHGFQSFDAVQLYARGQPVSRLKVAEGAEESVGAGFTSGLVVAVPKGAASRIKAELVAPQSLTAPVSLGQTVGRVRLQVDGKSWGEFPVQALEPVAVAGMVDKLRHAVRQWFNR